MEAASVAIQHAKRGLNGLHITRRGRARSCSLMSVGPGGALHQGAIVISMRARKTTLTDVLEATLLIATSSLAIEPPANRVAVGILSQLAFRLRHLLMGILEMLIASPLP